MLIDKILTALLFLGTAVSGVIGSYKLYRLVNYLDLTNVFLVCDNLTSIAFFASLALWCWEYFTFKKTPGDYLGFYLSMKVLSLMASVACFAHFVTSLLCFLKSAHIYFLDGVHQCCEMIMWVILALFFLLFRFSNKKAADEIVAEASETGGIQV